MVHGEGCSVVGVDDCRGLPTFHVDANEKILICLPS